MHKKLFRLVVLGVITKALLVIIVLQLLRIRGYSTVEKKKHTATANILYKKQFYLHYYDNKKAFKRFCL